MDGESEGEVAFFSAKRWDRRNRADLIESATPRHEAQVVGLYRDSNPLRLSILAAMSEDCTTAPQHLQWELPGGALDLILVGDVPSRLQRHTRSLYQFFEKVYPTLYQIFV